jgi:hypothetical protein
MTDDGGVLGNLPHSRPGKRSAKRDSGGRPAGAASRAAAKAERSGTPAAEPAGKAKAARKSAKPGRAAAGVGAQPKTGAAQAPPPLQPEPAGGAVTAAVRTAAGLAVTGVRVAGAVTQELLKRLPRP